MRALHSAVTCVVLLAHAWLVHPAGDASASARHARANGARPPALAVQVRLDRASFSPGEIDGAWGRNTRSALSAFQRAHGLAETGRPDARTLAMLEGREPYDVIADYELQATDVAGPWIEAPADLMAQANLPALGFSSPLERLGERFHCSPALLERLNPGARFVDAGVMLRVPNVAASLEPSNPAAVGGPQPAADLVVTVSKSRSALTVIAPDGRVVLHAPVTVGSEHDPLPIGKWEVTVVQPNPVFNYNPSLFWDADPAHAKARLPPGPNNPVGVVWIGISEEHYGLHGTPEPALIGRAESHGCIRLTNWDAARLATLVKRGTPVVFEE